MSGRGMVESEGEGGVDPGTSTGREGGRWEERTWELRVGGRPETGEGKRPEPKATGGGRTGHGRGRRARAGRREWKEAGEEKGRDD